MKKNWFDKSISVLRENLLKKLWSVFGLIGLGILTFVGQYILEIQKQVKQINDNTKPTHTAKQRIFLNSTIVAEIQNLTESCRDKQYGCFFSRVELSQINYLAERETVYGRLIDLYGFRDGNFVVDLSKDTYISRDVFYSENLAKEIYYYATKPNGRCAFRYIKDLAKEDPNGIKESFIVQSKRNKTCGKFGVKIFAIVSCVLEERQNPLYLYNLSFATPIKDTCDPEKEIPNLDKKDIERAINTMEAILVNSKNSHNIK